MVIGVCRLEFRIHDCSSLKGKRKIVKSILSTIGSKYNASVAETDFNDIYSRIEIGIAIVGNDRREINSRADKLLDLADTFYEAEFVDSDVDIITV